MTVWFSIDSAILDLNGRRLLNLEWDENMVILNTQVKDPNLRRVMRPRWERQHPSPSSYLVRHSDSSLARSFRAALCFSSSLSFSLLAISKRHFNRTDYFTKLGGGRKKKRIQKERKSKELQTPI